MKRREDLSAPRASRRLGFGYDPEAFGRFSESIARYLGTARFLVWQSGVIVVWIAYNTLAPESWQFDPWDRGLVLLTLVLSLQASYAAPLILLAQNRQEARDRVGSENDREIADRTKTDTEFLAREIAGVRLMLADVVTGEELREQLAALSAALDAAVKRIDDRPSRRLAGVRDARELLKPNPVAQHVAEHDSRWKLGIGRRHHACVPGLVRQQGHHRRGHCRRRRADQFGDAHDVSDPRSVVVAASCLDADGADTALEMRRTQHRQTSRQAVATCRRTSSTDPLDRRKAAVQQRGIGKISPIAVPGADRLGEPAQFATTACGPFDPLTVVPAERPSGERLVVFAGAGWSGGAVDGDVQLVAHGSRAARWRANSPDRPGDTAAPTTNVVPACLATGSRSSSARTSSEFPLVETTCAPRLSRSAAGPA